MSSGTDNQPPDMTMSGEAHEGLESLLHLVWKCEADWRFNDRLDMATKQRRQER